MDRCVLLTSTPLCVVSPWDNHWGCAFVIAERGETALSEVDVNSTHLSMINPLNHAGIKGNRHIEWGTLSVKSWNIPSCG